MSLLDHLELGEKKNIIGAKISWTWEVVPGQWCSSQSRTAVCFMRCEHVHWRGEAATIRPAATLVSLRALSKEGKVEFLLKLHIDLWQRWQSGIPGARRTCVSRRVGWAGNALVSWNYIYMGTHSRCDQSRGLGRAVKKP